MWGGYSKDEKGSKDKEDGADKRDCVEPLPADHMLCYNTAMTSEIEAILSHMSVVTHASLFSVATLSWVGPSGASSSALSLSEFLAVIVPVAICTAVPAVDLVKADNYTWRVLVLF